MDGRMDRSSSSSSLSDAENANAAGDENDPGSEVENSPVPMHNTSGESSSAAEYHSVSGNPRPSASRTYSRSPSSGSYYASPYQSSEPGPSPSKYPRREAPSTSGSGGTSNSGNYLPRQTESTLNGLYIPSITDTLENSGMPGGLPPHMMGGAMGGNNGGGHPPPDIKPDISSLTSPTSTHGGGYFHGYPPPGMGGAGNGMPSSTGGGGSGPPQMHSPGMHSPTSSLGSPLCLSPTGPSPSPGLPHSSSLHTKHICAICGDRASGKHYGVYSCEGCKGFFKRTVRKDLTYACRDDKNCMIDKRQRNRCQYCRYMKCLSMGMKREAVQEERQRVKEKGEEVESTSGANNDMPVEQILEAEQAVDPKIENYIDTQMHNGIDVLRDPVVNICQAADKQLFTLVEWAKRIPHFTELPLSDRIILLRAGWNELLIAGFSHRSIEAKDGIYLATGLHVHRSSAHQAGVGVIFDRVLTELVAKMREMKMDQTELGCLRAVVLFNPDSKGLTAVQEVEQLREKVYASLEEYCKTQYPDEPGRFAKLLLRLPALRSIGLKCLEHLFFFKLIGNQPIDTFLMEMLEDPSPSSA